MEKERDELQAAEKGRKEARTRAGKNVEESEPPVVADWSLMLTRCVSLCAYCHYFEGFERSAATRALIIKFNCISRSVKRRRTDYKGIAVECEYRFAFADFEFFLCVIDVVYVSNDTIVKCYL